MNALLLLGILMVSAYDSFYRDIARAVATSLQVSSQVMVQRMVRRQGCWLEHHFATGGRFLHIWSSWRRPVNISSWTLCYAYFPSGIGMDDWQWCRAVGGCLGNWCPSCSFPQGTGTCDCLLGHVICMWAWFRAAMLIFSILSMITWKSVKVSKFNLFMSSISDVLACATLIRTPSWFIGQNQTFVNNTQSNDVNCGHLDLCSHCSYKHFPPHVITYGNRKSTIYRWFPHWNPPFRAGISQPTRFEDTGGSKNLYAEDVYITLYNQMLPKKYGETII